MSGSSEAKTKPATQQKLRRSRRDGQVPQSQKFITLLVVSALLATAITMLGSVRVALVQFFEKSFPLIGQPINQIWDRAGRELVTALVASVGPFFGLAFAVVVVGCISYHRGVPFSVKPIVPDFKRLNPASGLQRMLGKKSWVESAVGFVQLVIWGSIAAYLILGQRDSLFKLYACGLPCMDVVAWQLFRSLAVAAIIVFLTMAVIEALMQQAHYAKDQKMTTSEYKREMKDNFGAPEVRRARARMRQEEKFFDTVDPEIVGAEMANMCFFSKSGAVAIRYHPEIAPVPMICELAIGPDAGPMRRKLSKLGFPEMKSRKIVETCLRRRAGTPAPQSIHNELAAGIARMFQ